MRGVASPGACTVPSTRRGEPVGLALPGVAGSCSLPTEGRRPAISLWRRAGDGLHVGGERRAARGGFVLRPLARWLGTRRSEDQGARGPPRAAEREVGPADRVDNSGRLRALEGRCRTERSTNGGVSPFRDRARCASCPVIARRRSPGSTAPLPLGSRRAGRTPGLHPRPARGRGRARRRPCHRWIPLAPPRPLRPPSPRPAPRRPAPL